MFMKNIRESEVDATTEYSLVPLLSPTDRDEDTYLEENSSKNQSDCRSNLPRPQTTIKINHGQLPPKKHDSDPLLCGGFNWITVLGLSTLLSWFLWSGYQELHTSWSKRNGPIDDAPSVVCPFKLETLTGSLSEKSDLTRNVLLISDGSMFGVNLSHPAMEDHSIRGCFADVITALTVNRLHRTTARRQEENFQTVESLLSRNQSINSNLFIAHNNLTVTGFGLGNFMFILSSMYGMAQNMSRSVALLEPHTHEGIFENLHHFIQHHTKSDLFPESVEVLHEKNWAIFDPEVLHLSTDYPNEHILLDGYRQVLQIFDDYEQDIRAMFAFKQNITDTAIAKIRLGLEEYFQRTNKTYDVLPKLVGVHVRRGDILTGAWHEMGHEPATEAYLLRTVLHMETLYAPVVFLVISNGIDYCKKVFKEDNVIFMEHHDSTEVDMALLTLMDYLVLSVGTFGWWGAYLGEAKEVHYYRDWPRNGTVMKAGINPADFWPSQWIAGI